MPPDPSTFPFWPVAAKVMAAIWLGIQAYETRQKKGRMLLNAAFAVLLLVTAWHFVWPIF